jgi:hypothetical protein
MTKASVLIALTTLALFAAKLSVLYGFHDGR